MGRDRPSRRQVLKTLGTATTGTAFGTTVLYTDRGAATDATISDAAWNDYEPWQKDQIPTCNEHGCIAPDTTIQIPNPGVMGFDVCVETNEGDLCVSMDGQLTQQYYDCAGRDIWAAGAEITLSAAPTTDWSADIWLGVDSDDCVWIGIEQNGNTVCQQLGCPGGYDPNPTIWDIRYFLDDIRPEMMSFIRTHNNANPQQGGTTGKVVAVIVLAGITLGLASSGGSFSANPSPA